MFRAQAYRPGGDEVSSLRPFGAVLSQGRAGAYSSGKRTQSEALAGVAVRDGDYINNERSLSSWYTTKRGGTTSIWPGPITTVINAGSWFRKRFVGESAMGCQVMALDEQWSPGQILFMTNASRFSIGRIDSEPETDDMDETMKHGTGTLLTVACSTPPSTVATALQITALARERYQHTKTTTKDRIQDFVPVGVITEVKRATDHISNIEVAVSSSVTCLNYWGDNVERWDSIGFILHAEEREAKSGEYLPVLVPWSSSERRRPSIEEMKHPDTTWDAVYFHIGRVYKINQPKCTLHQAHGDGLVLSNIAMSGRYLGYMRTDLSKAPETINTVLGYSQCMSMMNTIEVVIVPDRDTKLPPQKPPTSVVPTSSEAASAVEVPVIEVAEEEEEGGDSGGEEEGGDSGGEEEGGDSGGEEEGGEVVDVEN